MSEDTFYTITSKPDNITFTCPHCKKLAYIKVDDLEIPVFEGGFVKCSECGKEVYLKDWEYD